MANCCRSHRPAALKGTWTSKNMAPWLLLQPHTNQPTTQPDKQIHTQPKTQNFQVAENAKHDMCGWAEGIQR